MKGSDLDFKAMVEMELSFLADRTFRGASLVCKSFEMEVDRKLSQTPVTLRLTISIPKFGESFT
jgi:hypothetical protein